MDLFVGSAVINGRSESNETQAVRNCTGDVDLNRLTSADRLLGDVGVKSWNAKGGWAEWRENLPDRLTPVHDRSWGRDRSQRAGRGLFK
jgi:hypothetical protein